MQERDASNKRVSMASIERKVNKVNKQKLHVLQILPIFFGMPHFLGRAQVILIIFYPTCYIKHSAILGTQRRRQPPFTCVAKQGPLAATYTIHRH